MFAMQEVYERYKQDVFIYLVSLTHNNILSEDLLSETFLSAIKSLPNFKGKSSIKTWLFSIARHKWYDHLRREKKEVSFDHLAEHYLYEEGGLEEQVTQEEMSEKIYRLLGKESLRNKEIVLLRIEGYSFYEIAKKHDISESSARVIDFRTKKKLRNILLKEEEDG